MQRFFGGFAKASEDFYAVEQRHFVGFAVDDVADFFADFYIFAVEGFEAVVEGHVCEFVCICFW